MFIMFFLIADFHGPGEFPVIDLSLNITDPEDVIVQRGQNATIKCKASSSNGNAQVNLSKYLSLV